MIKAKKIMLLKHPVSADQKAEARSLGVKIIDARFSAQFSEDQIYQGHNGKVDQNGDGEISDKEVELALLQSECKEKGIPFKGTNGVKTLKKLLEDSDK